MYTLWIIVLLIILIITLNYGKSKQDNFSDVDSSQQANQILDKYNIYGYKYDNGQFKKNMGDIYKRLKIFEMERADRLKNDIEEGFTSAIDDYGFHQHNRFGQINFLENEEKDLIDDTTWLKNEENRRLLSGYNFLTEGAKEQILNEMDQAEKHMLGMEAYMKDNFGEAKQKLLDVQANFELKKQQEEIFNNLSPEEKAMRDYLEKEKKQEAKMVLMNQKISDLEKEQKGINLSYFDQTNSMKSLGDGQTLAVQNVKDNQYLIRANGGCLATQKNKEGQMVLQNSTCQNKKPNLFGLHTISDIETYQKHLTKPLESHQGVVYPFSIMTPIGKNKKCLNMRGNNLSLHDCENTKYQKFEPKMTFKNCGKYGN